VQSYPKLEYFATRRFTDLGAKGTPRESLAVGASAPTQSRQSSVSRVNVIFQAGIWLSRPHRYRQPFPVGRSATATLASLQAHAPTSPRCPATVRVDAGGGGAGAWHHSRLRLEVRTGRAAHRRPRAFRFRPSLRDPSRELAAPLHRASPGGQCRAAPPSGRAAAPTERGPTLRAKVTVCPKLRVHPEQGRS
jgi:hypothetical protein